jgi:hypothetical protein
MKKTTKITTFASAKLNKGIKEPEFGIRIARQGFYINRKMVQITTKTS